MADQKILLKWIKNYLLLCHFQDAKLLRTLCDLLEGSLMMYYSSSKSVEQPGEENNKNNTEECNKSHRNFYETWAAGFQRPLRKKATPVLQQKAAVGNVAEMGTIQEEHEHEHQQQHNKDLEAQIEGENGDNLRGKISKNRKW